MPRPRFRLLKLAWRLIFLTLFLAGWGIAALAIHVVVVPANGSSSASGDGDGFHVLVIPKNRFAIKDTYADTRGWTAEEAARHEALMSRLVEAGQADELGHLLGGTIRQKLDDLLRLRRQTLTIQ